jgi:TonB family protein
MMVREKSRLLPIIFVMAMLFTLHGVDADQQSASDLVQMLNATEGVDFTTFLKHVSESVKRSWYTKMPEAARLGIKGKVVLRFRIQKKGALDGTPAIETSSGYKTLDDGAVTAVVASAPFEQFPEAFKGPYVELRVTFLYNVTPPER